MGSGAKNHLFHGGPPTDREVDPDRRAGRDRRDPARTGEYRGGERRLGPRRSAELPVPIWQRALGLSLAIGLGIVVGLAIELDEAPIASGHVLEPTPHDQVAEVDPQALAAVQALHDEARALTKAEVALDERAHERWLPHIADIEVALEDPRTPAPIRAELIATIDALECVGVLERDPGSSCATLPR